MPVNFMGSLPKERGKKGHGFLGAKTAPEMGILPGASILGGSYGRCTCVFHSVVEFGVTAN